MRRLGRIVAVALFLGPFAGPPTLALPTECGPVEAALDQVADATLNVSESRRWTITVEDTNQQPGTQQRTVRLGPAQVTGSAWSATITPTQDQPLDAQNRAAFQLTVTAPTTEAGAAKDATINVPGMLTCQVNGTNVGGSPLSFIAATISGHLNVTATNGTGPINGGVDQLPSGSSSALLITVIGIAIIAGAGYLVLTTKPVGVRLRATESQKELSPGRGVSFPVVLQNRSDRPDTAVFNVAEVPAGWSAFMALGEISIGPKEEKNLWLMVKAPPDAKEGESVKVTLEARSKSSPGKTNRVELVAKVTRPQQSITGQESGTR